MRDSRVVERREQEAEAGAVEDLARFERRKVEPRSQRLEHVGRAAFRCEGAVPVLHHREAAGRSDDAGCGRDVDRSGEIPAGAAAVGEEIAGGWEGPGRGTQRERCAGQLVGRFAFDSKRDECGRHERFAQAAVDDAAEQLAGGVAIDIAAVEKPRDRRFDSGALQPVLGAGLPRKGQNLGHEHSPETKKPADGGRAVDDRWLVDQSRHRAAWVDGRHQR
jgi:hypothetical protein